MLHKRIHHTFLPSRHNGYHPHVFRHRPVVAMILSAVLLKLVVLMGLSLVIPSKEAFAEVVIDDVIRLTNQSRASNGLEPVTLHPTLNSAASLKAQDMVSKGYFNHYGPNGETPWQWFHAAGYRYTRAGENLASNFVDAETLQQAWMDSPTHRDNILGEDYQHLGLAIATGEINGKKTTIVVELFGATNLPITEVAGEQVTVVNNTTNTMDTDVVPKGTVSVQSEDSVSQVIPSDDTPFWLAVSDWLRQAYLLVAGVIALLLVIMIIVRLEIQHHRAVARALTVMGIFLLLASMEMHFLEGLGRWIEII